MAIREQLEAYNEMEARQTELLELYRAGEVEWPALAACLQHDPEIFFQPGKAVEYAKDICKTACHVRDECLQEALNEGIDWGVWGGLSERERRAILRKRPFAKRSNV